MSEEHVEGRDPVAKTAPDFIRALSDLTPRIFVTPTLVFLNVAVFAAMVLLGASPLNPEVTTLVEWGANQGVRTIDGEWWRLLSCLFLHGGLLHLALNCWVLWEAGQVMERLLGPASFAALYLASGLLASLTSLAWDPFAASVGASGAIFGLWGALLGFTLRQRDLAALRGLLRLRNIALVFVVMNVVFGLTQEHVDLAAHLGGLVAGLGGGLILSQPLSLEARPKRGRRLALLCAVSALLVLAFAAALPRRVIEVHAELDRLSEAQIALEKKFNDAFAGETQSRSISDMQALLEDDLLPAWSEALGMLEKLHDLPEFLQAEVDTAVRRARLQESRWREMAEDFGRFQDALSELQALEDEAMDSYERAVAEVEAGRLSNAEFVDILYRDVLARYESERKITTLAELREPLETMAGALRLYADTRQKAWRLYAEAVRTGDEEMARAASEEHLRAESMIARWAGVPLAQEGAPTDP